MLRPFIFQTPVAFFIFNRPDTTSRVFAEIAKARPPKLLVIGDGPRPGIHGEEERILRARAVIDRIDWPCDVVTNYAQSNMGCKHRVSSGIDWVFEQVDEAVILEDDCLPDFSFFRFCQEMLVHHRHDTTVGMISGDNFQLQQPVGSDSYYFSKYVHIWGWACWRNRWQGFYDVSMRAWPEPRAQECLRRFTKEKSETRYWKSIFERVYRGEIDTWDYQWCFANWLAGRINVLPAVNLISNIGFGEQATHTSAPCPLSNLPTRSMEFPIKHPKTRERNEEADRFSDRHCFRPPLLSRLYRRLANQISRMRD